MSIDDKYDEIKQLVYSGKQKGYLLYDEVNDVLPTEIINSSDEIDELFSMFDSVGIEVVDSEEKYQSDTRDSQRVSNKKNQNKNRNQRARITQRHMIPFACICAKWELFRC